MGVNLIYRETPEPGELMYIEFSEDVHYELVSWIGEDVTLRPVDGGADISVNGSFVFPVKYLRQT